MRKYYLSALLFILLSPTFCQATGIQIGRTRVIYDANKKEVPLSIINKDNERPWLIQSWTDSGDGKTRGPFIVTPPLFRLDPQKEQNLRITWSGTKLPEDRESLFYINVRSIPASEKDNADINTLRLIYKTRLKLFWRPKGLRSGPTESCKSLQFSRNGKQLKVTNNGAYYSVFDSLRVGTIALNNIDYVAPKSTATLSLPDNAMGNTLTWRCISDYGNATVAYTASLAGK